MIARILNDGFVHVVTFADLTKEQQAEIERKVDLYNKKVEERNE